MAVDYGNNSSIDLSTPLLLGEEEDCDDILDELNINNFCSEQQQPQIQPINIMGGGVGEGIEPSSSVKKRAGVGGVTLHGDSIDLRHLFPEKSSSREEMRADDDEHNNDSDDGRGGGGEEGEACSSLSVASAPPAAPDNEASNIRIRLRQAILAAKGMFGRRWRRTSSSSSSNQFHTVATAPHNNIGEEVGRGSRKLIRNNNGHQQLSQQSSLVSASTTTNIARWLLPLLMIINHALFFKAQTLPMWNLSYMIDVTITANAATLKSKTAANVLNIPQDYNYTKKETQIVETFTYMDAISKLWKGDGLGDAKRMSKIAAVLLVVTSGIWPHLKLLLLNLCWFMPFWHRMTISGGRGDNHDNEEQGYTNNNVRFTRSFMSNRITDIVEDDGDGGDDVTHKTTCGICCSDGRSHGTHTLRSPCLRTLSTLGKWSLADVLVVCILIAVLHLDWNVNPSEIRSGIEKEMPTLIDYIKAKFPDPNTNCESLLHYECKVGHALVIHYPACFACKELISNAYTHPEWTAGEGRDILEGIDLTGGGYARLRVMGMTGTYYFCAAVIMSILLSFVVDVFDEKDRTCIEKELLQNKREVESTATDSHRTENNDLELIDESLMAGTPLPTRSSPTTTAVVTPPFPSSRRRSNSFMSATSSRTGDPYARLATGNGRLMYATASPSTNSHLLKHAVLFLLAVSSLPLVYYGVKLPTMQRLVYGGGPTLLHEILGMIWEKEYSISSLVSTTGDAGGWDTFLLLTFGMFAIVGPILRSLFLLLHVLLGLPEALLSECIEHPRRRTKLRLSLYKATSALRKMLLPVIDALGAFCCWEVLIVALIMIQLEIPAITDTIYNDDRCHEADPAHGETCIEVQFNVLDSFLTVILGWAVLIIGSGLVMDVASQYDKSSSHVMEYEEKRYEFGQPIPPPPPRRQANLSRDSAWFGSMISSGQQSASLGAPGGNNQHDTDNERGEYYSPLQHEEDEDDDGMNDGLEQIVFV